jgi:hypothetical protein
MEVSSKYHLLQDLLHMQNSHLDHCMRVLIIVEEWCYCTNILTSCSTEALDRYDDTTKQWGQWNYTINYSHYCSYSFIVLPRLYWMTKPPDEVLLSLFSYLSPHISLLLFCQITTKGSIYLSHHIYIHTYHSLISFFSLLMMLSCSECGIVCVYLLAFTTDYYLLMISRVG